MISHNKFFIRLPSACVLLLMLSCICCCTNEEDHSPPSAPKITVIPSVYGLGDNAYNDLIMKGIMSFYEGMDNIELSLQSPHNTEEVKSLIHNWISSTSDAGVPCLLLLADGNYANEISELPQQLSPNQSILLVDSKLQNLPDQVYTFSINRYGASYLAGCMASPHEAADIMAAYPNDPVLETAIAGFKEGYEKYSNNKVQISYLADNPSGFAKPDSAYAWTSKIENSFIFPLAGGSNNGVYKYSREYPFYMSLVVGMDVDCSLYSHRIPFSMVLHIDQILIELLTEWYKGGIQKPFRSYGLAENGIEIMLSKVFASDSYIWEDYYLDDSYWETARKEYMDEAVQKEYDYEN